MNFVKVKNIYLRLVRRTYRLLRHKRLRNIGWLQTLIRPIFDRELWHPFRSTVARGMAIGFFCAMLPLPMQMLLASFLAMRMGANIPISAAACWVTNPLTIAPIILLQERLGAFLVQGVHIPLPSFLIDSELKLPLITRTLNLGEYLLGLVAMGGILAVLAYPLVYCLSALLPKVMPKKRTLFKQRAGHYQRHYK